MILPSGFSTLDYSVSAADKGWDRGWPYCENPSVTITLAITKQRLSVHPRSARLWTLLLNAMEAGGYECHTPENWCWGAECRAISGTNRPSNHSFNNAVDINAPANSYNSTGEHDIPDWVYEMFRRYGFGLGADYSGKKDWMHAETMGTAGDVDIMTALAELEFGNGTAPGNPNPIPTDWFDTVDEPTFDKKLQGAVDQLHDRLIVDIWTKTLNDKSALALLIEASAADDALAGIRAIPTDVWTKGIIGDGAGQHANEMLAAIAAAHQSAAPVTPPAPTSTGTYVVQPGDGFDAIAKKFGLDRAGLQKLNPSVKDVGNISIGQVLNVPK